MKKYILLNFILFAQLLIVAQDGNTSAQTAKKQTPKKEKTGTINGSKKITAADKHIEFEASKKNQPNTKKEAPNTTVESNSK